MVWLKFNLVDCLSPGTGRLGPGASLEETVSPPWPTSLEGPSVYKIVYNLHKLCYVVAVRVEGVELAGLCSQALDAIVARDAESNRIEGPAILFETTWNSMLGDL